MERPVGEEGAGEGEAATLTSGGRTVEQSFPSSSSAEVATALTYPLFPAHSQLSPSLLCRNSSLPPTAQKGGPHFLLNLQRGV